jgi:hypothetical protein
MATTMFFAETLVTPEFPEDKLEMEFGRSSFFDGISRLYITIDGKQVVMSEEQGQRLYDAMNRLGSYLGYDEEED